MTNEQIITQIFEPLARGLFVSNYNGPMTEALLEHYAAFIESQTGVPAGDTINSIRSRAKELMPDMNKSIEIALDNAKTAAQKVING